MKKTLMLIFSLSVLYLAGCAELKYAKIYPLPQGPARVADNIIYIGESPFAEIRYLLRDENGGCKGLAIYYFSQDREVWIYPSEGLKIKRGLKEYSTVSEIESFFYESRSATEQKYDSDVILLWGTPLYGSDDANRIFDISIAEDGSKVYFKTPGEYMNTSHKYLVEYGVSK